MATLYVKNIPNDLYEALRERARAGRRSIAAEILALLEENVPTKKELRDRHNLLRKLVRTQAKRKKFGQVFPSAEEVLRGDRAR
jgi:plasmid stability protein